MQRPFLIVLLWFGGDAVQYQSTFLDVFVANGTQGAETRWEQDTVTFTCSDSDPEDVNLVVGNVSYHILCRPPLYGYTTQLRFFIPKRIKKFHAEYCEGPRQLNMTTTSPFDPSLVLGGGGADDSSSPSRRRLLADIDIPTTPKDIFCAQVATTDKPFCRGDDVAQSCGCCCSQPNCEQNCDFCQNYIYSCKCINEGGDKDFCNSIYENNLKRAQSVAAEMNALGEFRQWILNQFALDSRTFQLAEQVNTSIGLFIQAAQIAQNRTNITANMVASLAGNLQQRFDSISATFGGIYQDLGTQGLLLRALDTQQRTFENATLVNFAALTLLLQQVAGNTSSNLYTLFAQQVALDNLGRLSSGSKAAVIGKVKLRRQLTAQIFEAARQAVDEGLTPFWSLASPGRSPSHTVNGGQTTVTIDSILVNLLNGTSPILAQQYQLTFKCAALTVLDIQTVAVTWLDLAGQLGPPGCGSQPGGASLNCQCWIEVEHTRCSAKSSFNWQQITDRTAGFTPYLLGSDKCTDAVVHSDWHSRTIDDLTVLNVLLGQLCSVTLASVPVQCTQTCTRQIQLVSQRLGVRDVQQPTNPDLVCALNYFHIFYVQPEPNLVFTLWVMWLTSQNQLLSDQLTLDNEFFGIPPGHITYSKFPFQRFSDNKTYECHTASFLAVGPETVPVFQLTPLQTQTQIDIQGYLTPPVCDSEQGCVFGTPAVSSQATTAGVATVPFEFLLPTGGGAEGVIGEWRVGGIPAMTSVFDVPVGLAPIGQTRADSLTYVWEPIPDGYVLEDQTSYDDLIAYPAPQLLDSWLENNIDAFSALKSAASPDATEVDFSEGQCDVASSGTVKQSVCLMFDEFSLGPLTDMRQGLLYLQPREWSYVATANIVKGELLQRVFDGCPQFKIVDYTNGYQEVFITNSLPTQVTVELSVSGDTSLCIPVGLKRITLQPKQAWKQLIPGCETATLNLYALESDGFTHACEPERNVSYSPDSQANVAYFTDDPSPSPVLGSAIQTSVVSFQRQSLFVLQQLAPMILPSPTLTVAERKANIAQILSDYNATLTAQVAEFQLRQRSLQTANEAIAPFLALLAALQTQSALVFTQMAVVARQISNGTALLNDLNAIQRQQTNATVEAIKLAQEALHNEAQEIIDKAKNKAAAQHGACNWCGSALSISPGAPGPVKETIGGVTKAANYVPGVSTVTDTVATIASPAAWICPILCALIDFLIPFVILALVICCVIQCAPGIVKACMSCFS